jgi:hypothetical protein
LVRAKFLKLFPKSFHIYDLFVNFLSAFI